MNPDARDGIAGADENGGFHQISAEDYARVLHTEKALSRLDQTRVAIIVAEGEILDGNQSPGSIGGESRTRLLRSARQDNKIKAVVLRVDSPGGSVTASEQIYREVQALRKAGKPVVVSMANYAASGGYYISAPADEIIASPATITGSIGIFAIIPTVPRTLGKVGVNVAGFIDHGGQVGMQGQGTQAASLLEALKGSASLAEPAFQGSIQKDPSTGKERFFMVAQLRKPADAKAKAPAAAGSAP